MTDAFSEGSAYTNGSTHTWLHNLIVLSNQLSEGSFLRWGLRVERHWELSLVLGLLSVPLLRAVKEAWLCHKQSAISCPLQGPRKNLLRLKLQN